MSNIAWKPFVSVPQTSAQKIEGTIRDRAGITLLPENSIPATAASKSWTSNVSQTEQIPIGRQKKENVESLSRMPLKVGDKVVLLNPQEIFWIQSKGNWACFHLEAADYDCRITMADVQMKLDPSSFLRVHRNAIVNLAHVSEFSLPRTGNAFAHLRNGKALPISRNGRIVLRHYLLSHPRFD